MKNLNKTATKVFEALIEGMNEIGAHRKIDNSEGCYMPVVVEIVGGRKGLVMVVSIAHYFEQNGDQMRDPEMLFIWNEQRKIAYPVSFRQDSLGIDRYAMSDFDEYTGTWMKFYPRMQADHTAFANTWMKNIKAQQGDLSLEAGLLKWSNLRAEIV